MIYIPVPPWRRDFDCARDPYTARNALGITSLGGGGGNVSNSGTPSSGQLARWVTSTTIEGVSLATAGIQPLDPELSAIAGLTSAADQAPYFTGSGTAALMTVTPAARTVLDDTSTANMLTTLGAQPAGSYQASDATLTALAAFNTNGLLTQTAPDTFVGRTLTGPAAGITVTNGSGVAGDPTLALANDLAALEALSGTNTIYYRSGTDAWSSVTVGTGLTFSGGTLAASGGSGPTAATQSDQETATSTTTFVSPGRQQYHPSAAKAFVRFAGSGAMGARSYNVSSVVRNSLGNYTINFTTPFSDAAYITLCTPLYGGALVGAAITTVTTSSVTVIARKSDDTQNLDMDLCVVCYGDQ